jgi:hypothetical protein
VASPFSSHLLSNWAFKIVYFTFSSVEFRDIIRYITSAAEMVQLKIQEIKEGTKLIKYILIYFGRMHV